jgi:hypothetical protein
MQRSRFAETRIVSILKEADTAADKIATGSRWPCRSVTASSPRGFETTQVDSLFLL